MIYNEFLPSEQLAPYVKCFWVLESDDPGPHEKERIFPDGSIEWIYHYGDLFRKFIDDERFVIQPRSFFHGQLRSYFELQATGKLGVFGVRFHPAGLHPFVDFAIGSINDDTLASANVWPEESGRIETAMLNATTEQRVAFAEQFLTERLQLQKVDHAVISCVNTIFREGGNSNIEALASELGIVRRVLERRFVTTVGLSPKFLARIIRFNKALRLIENKDFSSFTSVAHEGGFYDQAHFIRDFREFTGLNPKQYFSGNLEMVRFFNLD